MTAPPDPGPLQPAENLVLSPGDRRKALLDFLGSAANRLDLSVFRCDDFTILDALADATGRGVKVRVLVTQTARNWDRRLRELEALLGSMGAGVERYNGPLTKYHAKYAVADARTALVTSMNFTRKCLDQTGDFLVTTCDNEVVADLLRLFDHDRARGASFQHNPESRLVVGPQQAHRLLDLLRSARRTIRIVDHRLNDPKVLAVLRQQQDSGVSVEVLGDGALAELVSHGRMFLVDDTTALIGSFALTPASLNDRREVALILRDHANVEMLRTWFDQRARQRPAASLKLAEFVATDLADDDD